MAEGKKFIMGDYLTIADIMLYESILVMRLVHEESMQKYKNLIKL